MATRPTVTVLMPLLGAHRFASESIGSVLGQTFTDFELLIVATGREAADAVRLLIPDTCGLAGALNAGLNAATGDFIARQIRTTSPYPNLRSYTRGICVETNRRPRPRSIFASSRRFSDTAGRRAPPVRSSGCVI